MRKRILRKTGIVISELGYGCGALFGKNVAGKECLSEEDAKIIVKTSIQHDEVNELSVDMKKTIPKG